MGDLGQRIGIVTGPRRCVKQDGVTSPRTLARGLHKPEKDAAIPKGRRHSFLSLFRDNDTGNIVSLRSHRLAFCSSESKGQGTKRRLHDGFY